MTDIMVGLDGGKVFPEVCVWLDNGAVLLPVAGITYVLLELVKLEDTFALINEAVGIVHAEVELFVFRGDDSDLSGVLGVGGVDDSCGALDVHVWNVHGELFTIAQRTTY